MSEKSKVLSVLLHLFATITYSVSVLSCLRNGLPPQLDLWGHWKFLTFWNLNVHLITFATALFVDVFGRTDTRGRRTAVATLLDVLFNTVALPIGFFVSVSFWAIYAVDRDLIFPQWIEQYIPFWLNHAIHTVILPVVLIENYLVDHRRRDDKNGLKVTLMFVSAYTLVILYLGIAKQFWVYPVLRVLNWPFRLIFIGSSLGTAGLLYQIGGLLYDISWRSVNKSQPRRRKNAKIN